MATRSRSGYRGLESQNRGWICSSVQAKRNEFIELCRFCHAAMISDFAGTGRLGSRGSDLDSLCAQTKLGTRTSTAYLACPEHLLNRITEWCRPIRVS